MGLRKSFTYTVRFTGMVLLVVASYVHAEPMELLNDQSQHAEPIDDSVVSQALRRGLLRIGFDLFEPWAMCDINGELIGHEIDLARKIADDMGVRIQFVRTEWYYIIAALIEENFDVIVSGMAITPDRALLLNFTVPSGEFGTSIVANIELTAEIENFNVPEVTFAVRSGTTYETVVKTEFPNATLLSVSTPEENLRAILDGSAHATAVAQNTATGWIAANPDKLHSPFDQLFNPLPEAFALRKGDLDGLNFFDSWITHHKTNGWIDERRQYWFETRDWEDRVAKDAEVVNACVKSFEL